jgi:uracil-DNA glycosylase family 4
MLQLEPIKKQHSREYLESVLKTLQEIVTPQQYIQIRNIAIPRSGGNAKANRFKENLMLKEFKPSVPSKGKVNAIVAFVGASPGEIEGARHEPLVGPTGKTFNDMYLRPLGLKKSDVFITNIVPNCLTDRNGKVREPYSSETAVWKSWVDKELDEANPKIIIALGKTAKSILKEKANFMLPHPVSIKKFGDSGELARKLKQIDEAIKKPDEIKKPIIKEKIRKEYYAKIVKQDGDQQIVTGVVLEPYTIDAHGDTISPDEIEKSAHFFLENSRTVGDSHQKVAPAEVCESYIAPADFVTNGQKVMQGSWVISVKILDINTWLKVKNGYYTGFSVGGFGIREED